MSLFSSIQLANNALRATQIGLQVTGNNIANANTPGYIREEVITSPAPTQRDGDLLLGLGVQVDAVVQKIDQFLEERLRSAVSDRSSSETQEQAYLQLEQIVGELGDTDLSTSLNNFFASISEILNQPESAAQRNLAVLKGDTLAGDIVRTSERITSIRGDINDRITGTADDINRLLEEIRTLNIRISATEGGDVSQSDAVGLRDQRHQALTDLAEILDIRSVEQPNGTVSVFAEGDFLVFEGTARHVEAELTSVNGLETTIIRLVETGGAMTPRAGKLAGLLAARDGVLGAYLDQLDSFARTLAFEFNRVFSSGQGLRGHQDLTSEFAVTDADAALDAAGLTYTPVNGSFQVQVYNRRTGLTQTTDIRVDLNGLDDDDTTLADLAAALDAIDGVSAQITATRKLRITSDAADQEFTFADDSSGALAALGLNTFFAGTSARDLGVSDVLLDDPSKFAASRTGVGAGADNAVDLAGFLDRDLDSADGASLSVLYDRIVAGVTQGSSVSRAVANGFRTFEHTLSAQKLATSGVSLDEEAVKLIELQRQYQASARYIAAINDLFDVLINI